MTLPDMSRLQQLGLSPEAARRAAENFITVEKVFAARIGNPSQAMAWWVPGRIEVFGKHTDYGGGRSLTCPVERGFQLLASPRSDSSIRLIDALTGAEWKVGANADLPATPGMWFDYPATVVRRLARDFPGQFRGMDAIFLSSLPRAAGLSSSSALLITVALPLIAFNQLTDRSQWQDHLSTPARLAGYFGAMESGMSYGPFQADFGVGTHGGSEDHTAILCGQSGTLSCYSYLPVIQEDTVRLPEDLTFVIASSGIRAPKSGAARVRYNTLSAELAELLRLWRTLRIGPAESLWDALSSFPESRASLLGLLEREKNRKALVPRMEQFIFESEIAIPEAICALRTRDLQTWGCLASRSQQLAEKVLRNQLPESAWLASQANRLGAIAASSFGAGFGGSVWALAQRESVEEFAADWREQYHNRFPQWQARSSFFLSRPGPGATAL